MNTDPDREDKRESRAILLALGILTLLLVAAVVLALPLLGEFVATRLAPGIGVKDAAVIAFFVTVALLVVLALAAGDGLLGELQFLLAALLGLFLIIWFMIAWIY